MPGRANRALPSLESFDPVKDADQILQVLEGVVSLYRHDPLAGDAAHRIQVCSPFELGERLADGSATRARQDVRIRAPCDIVVTAIVPLDTRRRKAHG